MVFGFETYLSPFTERYGSPEMRELFSDTLKKVQSYLRASTRIDNSVALIMDQLIRQNSL